MALLFCSQLVQQFYNYSYSGHRPGEEVFNGTSNDDTDAAVTEGEYLDEYTLTFLWSLTTTLFVIGGMIGSYVAGFIANKLGQ